MIEHMARTIYEASDHNKPFSLLTAFQREKCEREALAVLKGFEEEIRNRFKQARHEVSNQAKGDVHSYEYGYHLGYSDALGELLESISGDASDSSGVRALEGK